MSVARCSVCHCYSRNCPENLPNHRGVPVGPNCPMNTQGRHYRDPADPTVPVCDYTGCTFFTIDEMAAVPYPTDVSLGPVVSESPQNAQSSDVAAIMLLLQQQKAENDARNEQMRNLTSIVSSLVQAGLPTPSSSPSLLTSQPPTYSATSTQPYPVPALPGMPVLPTMSGLAGLPNTVPVGVASAAASLTSTLQRNNGMQNYPEFPTHGNQQFQLASNPLAGMGAAMGYRSENTGQVINNVDQLYAATVKCKQLKAFEFASTAQFPYKSSLTQNNCNAVVFAYGSFKHLEALLSGLISNTSHDEILARVRHLKNVYEVACLSSNLATFAEPSWQVAREYDSRIISDIESGAKTWEGLSNGLETDAIYVAKEIVEQKKAKKPVKIKSDQADVTKVEKSKKDPKANGCTTYNTHRASEGCYWEHLNKGEQCVFEHFCSWCKLNRNAVEKHKIIQCEYKPTE